MIRRLVGILVPLGPYVREGDDNWFDIVRWSLLVMINAEEMGVTSLNVDHIRKTAKNPEVRRLLDDEADCPVGSFRPGDMSPGLKSVCLPAHP